MLKALLGDLASVVVAILVGLVFLWSATPILECSHASLAPALVGVPIVTLGTAALLGRWLHGRWAASPALLAGLVVLPLVVSVPDFVSALDRGKQKRTMADMRSIGHALDAIAQREGKLPGVASVAELNARYGLALPSVDAWNGPLELHSGSDGYTVVSAASCGELDPHPWPGSTTTAYDADIVLRDGRFFQWPEGQLGRSR